MALALLISFGNAPSAHFHPEDPDHDHDHAELLQDHHEVPGPHLEAADHDETAQFLNWLAGDGSTEQKLFAELVAAISISPTPAHQHHKPLLALRNHDPPSLRLLPARAPPA